MVSPESALRLFSAMRSSSLPLDVVVTELGILTEEALVERLSLHFGIVMMTMPEPFVLDAEFETFDLDFAKAQGAMPVSGEGDKIVVALADPTDEPLLEMLRYYFDREVEFRIVARKRLLAVLERISASADTLHGVADQDDFFLEQDVSRLKDIALEAPIINLVARMAQNAFDIGATDIHIEPLSDRVQIRYRRDGVLSRSETVQKSMLPGIISRIKILSGLNIVERRLPQDGRMRLSMRGSEIDFRVSVVPSMHGETIVLRILRNLNVSTDLATLGFDEKACGTIEKLASSSHGILIVTGPTGSGKTTTLYSLVTMLHREDVKIFTIEDPVEYQLDGITQLQVNLAISLDFPRALRSVLRQDPDIILVGEIRDRETAQIAIQAALTGHLVLTTLHTNSAAGAVTRLRDMGIEEYLIASTLRGAIAQRLVRLTCSSCHGKQPQSCRQCRGTGYSGRTVVYEILEGGPEIEALLESGASERDIRAQAARFGMTAMEDCAARLVEAGVTSRDEMSRVLNTVVDG
ncbi:GspE/PulE family protein [Pararhizobium gei]|uniref:GspE/PulE family protein n=1 Tax=Pararhizobium gei TaxID=1395951 RepID=UPI0023DC9F22|nr:GspE/PulE family protein [Rhizobium gei]